MPIWGPDTVLEVVDSHGLLPMTGVRPMGTEQQCVWIFNTDLEKLSPLELLALVAERPDPDRLRP